MTLRRWPRQRWALAASATMGFVLLGFVDVGAGVFESRFRFYPPSFPDFYAGWLNFETRCGPAGTRVAYAGTDLPYYLLGRGLRNEVRYINVDRHRDWLLHDYHREALSHGQGTWPNSRPGWDRIRPDYRAWLDNLDAEGIQLLVVTRANPAGGNSQHRRRRGIPDRESLGGLPPRTIPTGSTARTRGIPGSGSTGSAGIDGIAIHRSGRRGGRKPTTRGGIARPAFVPYGIVDKMRTWRMKPCEEQR